MTVALKLDGISRRFSGIAAVRRVDFSLQEGECCALLGPNGAGKTTLFNVIAGDIPPSTGTIELFGENVTRMRVAARVWRGLRRTYQESALFDSLSVADNLFLSVMGPGRSGHLSIKRPVATASERWRWVEDAAATVGLTHCLMTPARELSHGERRQLEIGLVLGHNPRLILLDEPAAGLSPEERTSLSALLRSLARHNTVVIIEHDMDMALSLAERVIVLSDGEVIADGTSDEIAADPTVRQVYLGAQAQ